MPYQRPSWAEAIRSRYNQLTSNVGNADKTVQSFDRGGMSLNEFPQAGAIRRAMPDVSIPGPEMPDTGNVKISLAREATKSSPRTFTVTGARNGVGTVMQKGQVLLRDIGNVLEKTDPSMVIGAIKGTVKETAESTVRFAGSVGLAGQMVADKLFKKLVLEGRLSKEEMEQLDLASNERYLQQLKDLGYDLSGDEVNKKFRGQVGSDAFNVATTIATAAPLVSSVSTAAKTFSGGKPLLSLMEAGFKKSAVMDSIKKGGPLIVDVAGNVFAKPTTKSAVKYVFSQGVKDVLKFSNNVIKPLAIDIYKQGMTLELINEARKFIDPESALRIERDQRKYVDSLELGERLFLDLAVGFWLPFEVPGLRSTYRMIENAQDTVDLASASRAIDKMFSDDKSIEVLNRLAQYNDVQWGNALDVQLKGNLMRHLMTVLDEDATAKTVDHFTERMLSWANDSSVSFLNKRRDIENVATNLSWYSNKLGRALEPHEQIMHWFITETQGKYVGDLGSDLVNEFEKALKLRTTGIPAGKEIVTRVIERNQQIQQLAGEVVKVGDAGAARQAIDAMLNDKTDLLVSLKSSLNKVGGDLNISGGKVIVPDQFKNIPEVRALLDNIAEVNNKIAGTLSEARAIGIPDEILRLPSNKWLLDVRTAYDRYNDIVGRADSAQQLRAFLQNVSENDIARLKAFVAKNPLSRDKILTGELPKLTKIITDSSDLRGTVLKADATDDELLEFLLGMPTKKEATGSVPKAISSVLNKAEKEALQMNEAVSNFDKQLLEISRKSTEMTLKGEVPFNQAIKETVEQVREIEAQLPRGAFAPEFLAKDSRWGAGVTPVPLEKLPVKIPGWAQAYVKLQDANGITRTLTDYMVPHDPTDIYIKAQNRLADLIGKEAPDKVEAVMRGIAKLQDEGVSMIPVMPGGGPKWEALGKPMISGVDWSSLDKLGNAYGVKGLGKMTREAFVNTMTESGIKPGIVDRLRAAPGVGAIYDALYRQYMLARFAINPIFHAQQVPETALLGFLRSFNLPQDMSKAYLKSVVRNPLSELNDAEQLLYKTIYGGKLAGNLDDASDVVRGSLSGVDVIKGTTFEERKRLAAFIAEFPVRVRGTLFDFPALKNVDPLTIPEYRDFILKLQDNPAEIAKAIDQAFSTKGFDIKLEAIRRAVKSTQTEVQKLVSYNLNRSALEKDLHAILFPFSYLKKFWSEVGKFTGGGSVARAGVVGDVFQGISDINDSPTMIEVRAKYPTMVGWIWSMSPINPLYPVVDLQRGSLGLGGIRATPAQAIMYDTFVDPDGKYNLASDPDASLRKLGGGGANFYLRDLPAFYNEIFKNDSPEQQKKYIYMLNRLQIEAQLKKTE